MKILGIETSCDETSAAVIIAGKKNKKVKLVSNVIASSITLHAKTGGIIPEIAAREQIKYIIPVIDKTLKEAEITEKNIDAISVTIGPGLIGSLLVGVETAKTLSYVWKKPIIPVNHLFGHIYANWIEQEKNDYQIRFPALSLIVSGGHTDIVLMKDHNKIKWISGTRDDAAGEAFDKIGRLLGLSYPAGPIIEQLAKKGNPKAFNFPRPLLHEDTLDFSFSGLKTAALREIQKLEHSLSITPSNHSDSDQVRSDLCLAVQNAIIDVLVQKTLRAAEKYNVKSILLSGGVAANQTLTETFKIKCSELELSFFVPQKNLCTDNAAMIASASFYNYKEVPWQEITANPELYFE